MTEAKPKTLQEALVGALAEMPNPVKNADNPAFKRDGKPLRYADLEATLDACKPILAACGIAVMQMPVNGASGEIGVRTVLIGHGEEMDCGTVVLPMEGLTPQKAAGAITYARRYALTALFGLAQEDDDANGASAPKADTPRTAARSGGITAKQAGYLVGKAKEYGYTRDDITVTAKRKYGLGPDESGKYDLVGLTKAQMDELLAAMEAHPRTQGDEEIADEMDAVAAELGATPVENDHSTDEIPF